MATPYNYRLKHIKELRKHIVKSNQVAPSGFFSASDTELQACYNGIGPDMWSKRFRGLVTELLKYFESDALIHDWEYTYQPKTYVHFTLANLRFAANAFINAYDGGEGKWATVWGQSCKGILLAILCQLFGWLGYKMATIAKINKGI